MNTYKTFDEYWNAEGIKFTNQPPILEAVFREVALKAWNAACMSRMSDVHNSVQKTTYPNGELFVIDDDGNRVSVANRSVRNTRFVKTGEFRAPKKGEWYLSGAQPHAYMANADFSAEYHILVRVKP